LFTNIRLCHQEV